jgi:hypothetical protein
LTFPSAIDNTQLSAYKKCPQNFWRAHIQNIRAKGKNIHLTAGGAFAAGLCSARRAYYEDKKDSAEAEQIGLKTLYETYGEEVLEQGASGDKSVEGVVRGYESYMLEYPFATDHVKPLIMPNGKAGVEFSFAVPLQLDHPVSGDPLLYCGRFDMLGVYNDSLFIVDEKTTSSLGEQWKRNWDLDSQFTGYCWGARVFGHPVAGALIRGVGLLKTKVTHSEAIIYRPSWQIDRFLNEAHDTIRDMVRDWHRGHWRFALDKSACNAYGGCQFLPLCSSPTPDTWIETGYELNEWDPLAVH